LSKFKRNHLPALNKQSNVSKKTPTIGIIMVLFILIFTMSWYLFFADSTAMKILISIMISAYENVVTNLFSLNGTQGIAIAFTNYLPTYQATKYLNILFQFFIVVGACNIFIFSRTKLSREYKMISLAALVIAFVGFFLPYFAVQFEISRVYHITQLILAPFSIVGGLFIINMISQKVINKIYWKKYLVKNSVKIVGILLTIFFIFNSGLVYKLSGEITPTAALISLDSKYDYARFNDKEVTGANWFFNNSDSTIYADQYRYLLLSGFEWEKVQRLEIVTDLPEMPYLFLGTFNINHNLLYVFKWEQSGGSYQYMPFNESMMTKNKIYDNGGSWIVS
jgi:uncharacterized membrane protein